MGAPTLKAKQELHYRRCTTSKSCRYCNHCVWGKAVLDALKPTLSDEDYARMQMEITDDPQTRCRIIGIKPGRAYRISPNGLCDRYDNSEYLARLGTNWSSKGD